MSGDWEALPAPVRAAITARCGPACEVSGVSAGGGGFSVLLRASDAQPVCCRGVQLAAAGGRTAQACRRWEQIASYVPAAAPRLLWQAETAGWLLTGFEYVGGARASLAPLSPDLGRIASVLACWEAVLSPCPVVIPRLGQQWRSAPAWRRLAQDAPAALDAWTRRHLAELLDWEALAGEVVGGNTLCHTNLHAGNILIGDAVRVTGWQRSRRAAAWADPAFLVIRLIAAGHTPGAAEGWAQAIPAWRAAPGPALTAFAVAAWGIRARLEHHNPAPQHVRLTRGARQWASHRLETGTATT